MISIKIDSKGWAEFCRVINFAITSSDDKIFRVMRSAMAVVDRNVQKHLTGGNPLNVVQGNLRSRLFTFVEMRDSHTVVGHIEDDVFYGWIHEYSGTFEVKAHTMKLRQIFGNWIVSENAASFLTVTRGPYTMTFPERPWMRPGVEESLDKVTDMLSKIGILSRESGAAHGV